MKKKRIIFFSEDHVYGAMIDQSLGARSDFEYGGWYKRVKRLVAVLKSTKPDFLLMDLAEKIDPYIIHAVKKYDQSLSLVIISSRDDHESIRQTFKSGAHGYLIKYPDIQETMQDVSKLAQGGVALSASAAKSIVTRFWKTNNSPLTNTETKVLKFVSLGHTYSSLAKRLR